MTRGNDVQLGGITDLVLLADIKPGFVTALEVVTHVDRLRKLLAGRIRVLLTNWRNTEPVLERLGMRGQVHTLAPSVDRLSGYFAFRRDKPDLPFRHAMARQLNEMARGGRIAAINTRYGLSYP